LSGLANSGITRRTAIEWHSTDTQVERASVSREQEYALCVGVDPLHCGQSKKVTKDSFRGAVTGVRPFRLDDHLGVLFRNTLAGKDKCKVKFLPPTRTLDGV
jgi:hypothetical protein